VKPKNFSVLLEQFPYGSVFWATDPNNDSGLCARFTELNDENSEINWQIAGVYRELLMHVKAELLKKSSIAKIISIQLKKSDITSKQSVFSILEGGRGFLSDVIALRKQQKSPKPWTDKELEAILLGIGKAIFALGKSQLPIFHGDVRAENIIISDDGELKLTNFASALDVDPSALQARATQGFPGIARYQAPELKNAAADVSLIHTLGCDMYSLGKLISELLESSPGVADSNKDLGSTVNALLSASPHQRIEAWGSFAKTKGDLSDGKHYLDLSNEEMEGLKRLIENKKAQSLSNPNNRVAIGKSLFYLGDKASFKDIIQNADNKGIESSLLADYFTLKAYTFYQSSVFTEAAKCLNEALDHQKKTKASLQAQANTHVRLGDTHAKLKDKAKAQDNYEKALAIRLKHPGTKSALTAALYSNIGLFYETFGEFEKAVDYQEKSLNIKSELYASAHDEVAAGLHNLGSALAAKSDHLKAIGRYKEALEMKIKLHGKDYEGLMATYDCLGQSYAAKGDQEKAIAAFREDLRITHLVYGKDCEDSVGILKNIGTSYMEWNKLNEAREALSEGIAIAGMVDDERFSEEIEAMKKMIEEIDQKEAF
jgi:tetratricopeptide (TPR) repeat protein